MKNKEAYSFRDHSRFVMSLSENCFLVFCIHFEKAWKNFGHINLPFPGVFSKQKSCYFIDGSAGNNVIVRRAMIKKERADGEAKRKQY